MLMIEEKALVYSTTCLEIDTKATLWPIYRKVKEHIIMLMAANMKDLG